MAKDHYKKLARGKPCQIRVAGIGIGLPCAGEDTVVLCHFTMPGYKAMGSRAASLPDVCGAWGCRICHDIVDGRIETDLSADVVRLYHAEGVMRTLDALVRLGELPNP